MRSKDVYYHIHSSQDSLDELHEDWERRRGVVQCEKCFSPLISVREIDVQIDSTQGFSPPLLNMAGGFPGVVWRDFISPLGESIIRRDLYLGTLSDLNGVSLNEWATYNSRYRATIRGTSEINQRICEACGQELYFALGNRYLSEKLPDGMQICMSDLPGLVIASALLDKLDTKRWKKQIFVDKLVVKE